MALEPAQDDGAPQMIEEEIADSSITQKSIAEPETLDLPLETAVAPGGLRTKTARGLLINSGFRVGIAGVNLGRQVGVAAFLTASVYGLWGLLITTLMTLAFMRQVGIADKYIQQREDDQVAAFQKAFTLQFAYTLVLLVIIAIAIPIYALGVYGRPEILVPGFVLSLSLIATTLQTPTWIFYRRMDYLRQRSIEVVDPLVTTIATLALLIAGMELWGLVIGFLTGSIAGAAVALIANPYPLAFRFDRRAMREYFSFSWPLFVSGIGGLLVVQGTVIIGNAVLGLAAVGAIGLATNFSRFSNSIEQLINTTMYPAVSAVQERRDLLLEVFVKSNRLGLMWALPFGIGLTLFAADLVHFGLGSTWEHAIPLLQIFGLTFGFGTIAFGWGIFYKALGRTRPSAVTAVVGVVVFFAVTVPLMLTVGLIGYGIGMAAATMVQLCLRGYFLARLFRGFNLVLHALRAVAPIVPAVAAVLLIRIAEGGGARTFETAVVEMAAYTLVVVAATYLFERRLIKEAIGYLTRRVRRERTAPAQQAGATAG
jgi:O-antigen/teichoic acid export membrane protein